MWKSRVWIGILAAGLGLVAREAEAQSASGDRPALRVAISYGTLRETVFDQTYTDKGFQADVAVRLMHTGPSTLEVVGDVGSHRNAFFEDRTTGILGGARWSVVLGRVVPFGQMLTGVECCGPTGLVFQPGGGVDVSLNAWFGVRIAADYRIVRYETQGVTSTLKRSRASFGIVFPIGRH